MAATGCVQASSSQPLPSPAAGNSAAPGTLADAVSSSRLLGPTGRQRQIRVTLALKGRDPQGLSRLIAEGRTITAADFATRFGPDPVRVGEAMRELWRAGLRGH